MVTILELQGFPRYWCNVCMKYEAPWTCIEIYWYEKRSYERLCTNCLDWLRVML